MCGIIGYTGNKESAAVILDGLKRLEYRGYDSAGIAIISGGRLELRRTTGKVQALDNIVRKSPVSGKTGVGHTRWATHGKPSEENAHPHTDCTGEIVVVHNGIIENYIALREKLSASGHKFNSETDTEVVAHLIEEQIKSLSASGKLSGEDFTEPLLFEAVRRTTAQIKGSYALGILWSKCPGVLMGAKMKSPMVVGIGSGEYFLSSDIAAFLPYTKKVVFLEDGEIAVLKKDSLRLFSVDGKKLQRESVQVQWDRAMAEKGGYRHFMLKEIHEQPQAVEDTLRGRLLPFRDGLLKRECAIETDALKQISGIQIAACGTAYHAGLVAKYIFEHYAKIPAQVDIASEFRYRETPLDKNTLLLAISQSGETADTLAAVREAKKGGLKSLAICNCIGSTITRDADFTLYTHCGPEIGVASTKAFLGQLSAIYVFALHLAAARGAISDRDGREYAEELLRLPGLVQKTLELEDQIKEMADKYAGREHFLFLGRHVNFPIALEGALKIKEISYVHAEGYAGGEMKHGPIAIIENGMPVIAIATDSRVQEKMAGNMEEAIARGAKVVAIVNKGAHGIKSKADSYLEVPAVNEFFSPVVNVVPLQLFAYYIAVARGCDVDQPRNLAKSVTVE